jgi:hypothetical protein
MHSVNVAELKNQLSKYLHPPSEAKKWWSEYVIFRWPNPYRFRRQMLTIRNWSSSQLENCVYPRCD